ncbi:MAG: Na+/H+ antiporter NhaC family protein [Sarcina sp.]
MDGFGVLSLIPPILTIILAIKTKNVIISLFIGLFSGVLILNDFNPFTSIQNVIGDYFFVQLTDSYNAGVLVLLTFIGGFVALMESSGGARAFATVVSKYINTKLKTILSAWIGGIIIFFSDLGTPLIIGPIFEPIFDKAKISREKLAWIIDTTASPIAVLVPFIGWGVYVMGLLEKEFVNLNIRITDYEAFINAIPFQFYPILCLILVPLISSLKLDFGPMAKAEKRVVTTGEIHPKHSKSIKKLDELNMIDPENSKSSLVFIPILILLATLLIILIPLGFPFKKIEGSSFRVALSTSYLFAAISIIILMIKNKIKTFEESFNLYISGMQKMFQVAIILVLAWSLGSVIKNLGTSAYIVQIVDGNLPVFLIPLLIFICGACMSFATGSSWGTFAIMIPLAVPLAINLNAPLFVCIGAVLSGGLFGDHCSPISDTTILSSTGAGCDLLDHVKTQIPYAILTAVVSGIVYVFAGFIETKFLIVLAVIFLFIAVYIMYKITNKREGLSSKKNLKELI